MRASIPGSRPIQNISASRASGFGCRPTVAWFRMSTPPCPLPVEPVFQIGSLLRTFEQQPLPEIIVCSFRINQIPRRNR